MITNVNFSQHRCREMAATQRLMMDMPESKLTLITRIAMLVSCDYDATLRLQDLTNEIYRTGIEKEAQKLKRGAVPKSTKLTGREGRTK